MIDLRSRLDEMAGPLTTPSGTEVRADLARGRRALRRRRAGQLVAGAAVAVAAGTTAFTLASPGAAPVRRVNPPAAQGVTQLVAYHGAQPEGYTLDKVPAGWEVQGVDAYSLTLAPKGTADKDPHSFVGKIAVMLQSQDDHSTPKGTPVQVGDRPGVLVEEHSRPGPAPSGRPAAWAGGATMLYVTLPSGGYLIVQVWDGLGWGQKEIVAFAVGVHVHDTAKRGHG